MSEIPGVRKTIRTPAVVVPEYAQGYYNTRNQIYPFWRCEHNQAGSDPVWNFLDGSVAAPLRGPAGVIWCSVRNPAVEHFWYEIGIFRFDGEPVPPDIAALPLVLRVLLKGNAPIIPFDYRAVSMPINGKIPRDTFFSLGNFEKVFSPFPSYPFPNHAPVFFPEPCYPDFIYGQSPIGEW